MATAAAAKPALTFEQHVADKVARYDFALDNLSSAQEPAVRIVPKDLPRYTPGTEVVLVMRPAPNDPGGILSVDYHGPEWKRHHLAYYATAAYWVLFGEDRRLPAEPLDVMEDIKLPLPPSGPPCARCGKTITYECAHVGGRGTCWRNRCSGLDDGSCDRVERWRS